MNWFYEQPVKIIFGNNSINKLPETVNGRKTLLVTSPHFTKSGFTDKLSKKLGNCRVFDKVSPNPDAEEVNLCAKEVRGGKIECIAALGGGSVIDLAKAASLGIEDIRKYTAEKSKVSVIAIPTTAGTGSEVTNVAVISDRKKGSKMPLVSDSFYPEYAIIDPSLTYSLPPRVTAVSGIDVLCHAVEGYWSKNHQPICDSMAFQAIKLVFDYLPRAYKNGNDTEAREKMAEASLMAGLAFSQPKTTASHACSFPLTSIYGIPHGEACGLTLDFFTRINEKDPRTRSLIMALEFTDVNTFADKIFDLKQKIGLRTGLKDLNLSKENINELIQKSKHPNLLNNPVVITDEILLKLYNKLKER